MKRDMSSWVYFVRRGEMGAIKIGSSNNPEDRMSQLQVGSDEPLHLMLRIRGGAPLERALHMFDVKFGEWFHPSPFVMRIIALLQENEALRKERIATEAKVPNVFDLDDVPPDVPERARFPRRATPPRPQAARFDLPPETFDLPPDDLPEPKWRMVAKPNGTLERVLDDGVRTQRKVATKPRGVEGVDCEVFDLPSDEPETFDMPLVDPLRKT